MSNFWQSKSLEQMSSEEWESLCDGCGQCCLIKLEDDQTGDLYRTRISCHLLDLQSGRCKDYLNRLDVVSECVEVSLSKPEQFEWMPETCAYRLLYEGKPLYSWHPLISKETQSVDDHGLSVKNYAISEEYIHPDQFEDHLDQKIK